MKVVGIHVGSAVTIYEIRLAEGVRVKSLRGLEADVALCLGVQSVMFDYAFGNGSIGVQVPNATRGKVNYSDFEAGMGLSFVVGHDVIGGVFRLDLAKLPHLLIAGQTGSGKSVALNCLISSLIDNNTVEDLRMILVDPKRVEFMPYAGVPHLYGDVITETNDVIEILKTLVEKMESRYALMESAHARSLDELNEIRVAQGLCKVPKIVLVIDELGDIMLREKKQVEDFIVRLGQKSRACGIHMVLATQRPSCDVVTGLIKANIPARLVCKVASTTDSVVVLGQGGAESLLGQGDMLYSEGSVIKRLQGAWISNNDIEDVIMRAKVVAEVQI